MRFFNRKPKRDPKSYDPRKPHPYIDATDAGTAGMAVNSAASGISGSATSAANLAATSRMMRTVGCAVPGCGKAAAEDIHATADE